MVLRFPSTLRYIICAKRTHRKPQIDQLNAAVYEMSNNTPNQSSSLAPESLALSASLFTSTINSWIPKDFGVKKSEEEKRKDFERAFKAAGIDENDRLGVGHPLFDAPKPKASTGLGVLGKRLAKGKPSEDDLPTGEAGRVTEEDDDEEAESRSRSVGKTKQKSSVLDLLSGRSKKKRLDHQTTFEPTQSNTAALETASSDPLLLRSQPSPGDISSRTGHPNPSGNINSERHAERTGSNGTAETGEVTAIGNATPHTPSTPGGSGNFPLLGPVALDSPQAKRILAFDTVHESSADGDSLDNPDGDDDGKVNGETGGGKMSKSQIRREKRKRKKLAEKVPRGSGGA